MRHKIIKIGSSAGITIPKKQLDELGLSIGNEVDISIKPPNKKLRDFSEELDKFMDEYREDLASLAKR